MFQVKALGQALWDAVVRYLNLLEADYFDLEFQDLRNIHVRPESMASVWSVFACVKNSEGLVQNYCNYLILYKKLQ